MSFKSNLQANLSDSRSRIFLFLMVAIIVIVLIFAYTARNRTTSTSAEQTGITASSNVKNPGASLDPIPGTAKTTSEYEELRKQQLAKEAQAAIKQTGDPSSVLPSLNSSSNIDSLSNLLGGKDNSAIDKQRDDQRRLQEQLLKAQQNQLSAADQQKLAEANKQIQALMARQTQVLAQNWAVTPQKYVKGKDVVYPKVNRNMNGDNVDNTTEKPKIFYKAGDILFGVMITSVNSDEPGPVLARIISGPLNSAKLIGRINPATIPTSGTAPKVSKALVLEFNVLNIPGMKTSVPVKAVAIDPNTARTGIVTSIDNHYLLRYGSFFAANFLAGLGDAISMQSQTKVVTGNGSTDIGRTAKFSSEEEALVALGRMANAFAQSINFLDTPPTVKVSSGTAIGLLLQGDLVISGDNTDKVITRSLGQDTDYGYSTYNSATSTRLPSDIPVTSGISSYNNYQGNSGIGLADTGGRVVP